MPAPAAAATPRPAPSWRPAADATATACSPPASTAARSSSTATPRTRPRICHPGHAAAILAADPLLAAALPCRIAVSNSNGTTRLSMLSPQQLLAGLSGDSPGAAAHQATAAQVEAETLAILNEAAG
ncbi:MAG: DUF302 domain-containing protein [Synechococcaceae bacterium WBB_10_009]|nr:DUF302 domain-containing protein [Synechococcaceae bacterium WBB_10_009]